MQQLRTADWRIIALVSAVVILAVAGLAMLAAYFLTSDPAPADAGWINPIAAIESEAVAPDLAALSLAGEPDERVIRAALDASETETAFATLAYSVLLGDQVRSGQWLLLANAVMAHDQARALICIQAALDQASLGPALNDLARADISLQTARGFAALDRSNLARLAVAQGENVARYSLTLLPAQRRDVLGKAIAAYQLLGDQASAQGLRVNLDAYTEGPGVEAPRIALLIPTLRGGVVLPSEVESRLSERQAAAAAMAARWLSSGEDDRSELARRLGSALAAEDASRSPWYGTGETLPLPDRLALLHDRVTWLLIKYRASRLDYGASLVPEWEAQSGQIEIELMEVFTGLVNGYGQQLDTLEVVEALRARVELLRQALLWTRLGIFPGDAETTLRSDLIDASRELWSRQGSTGLTVITQSSEGRLLYLLAGAAIESRTSGAQRMANVGRP